jgi:hypothetical protein
MKKNKALQEEGEEYLEQISTFQIKLTNFKIGTGSSF